MTLHGKFLPAHRGCVLNEAVRIQVNIIDVVIVCRQGAGDACISRTLIRRRDRQHSDHDRNVPRNRIYADPTCEGMDNGAVRHLFVIERRDPFFTARLHDIDHKGRIIRGKGGSFKAQVKPEKAFDELAVGRIAPHKSRGAAIDFDQTDWNRIKSTADIPVFLVQD